MKKKLNLIITVFGLIICSGIMMAITPVESAIQNNFSTQIGYICAPMFSGCALQDLGLAAYLETQVGNISDVQACTEMYAYLYWLGTKKANNPGWANNFAEFVLQNYSISVAKDVINSIETYINNLKQEAGNLVQEGKNFINNHL